MSLSNAVIWLIAAATTMAILFRPWRLPEYVWATAGAVALVVLGLLPARQAGGAILEGTDVYLFLIGMMLVAEVARQAGLFDWVAVLAADHAAGSARRLFDLVFLVGTGVTVLLSNDATAVVLTPAVYAVTRVVGAPPLPYLYVCAFIANAASFVLPISNPANLVVFGDRMPALGPWLAHFALPSALAIGATYVTLRLVFRHDLRQPLKPSPPLPPMTLPLRMAALGVAITAGTLLITSALGQRLGLPTLIAGCVSAALVLAVTRSSPIRLIKGVAWGVLPLVAGLFVLVEGMAASGVLQDLANLMRSLSADAALWAGGVGAALSGNVINNLPAGLMAGTLARMADLPSATTAALLIGIDLGPNLSVSGSLATLLWLLAVRREGMHISALSFLRLGIVVMPPALILALGALHVFS
ncbi:arsenic transporter [Achromobacter mucicolens]|jgi:arsenical pump membrane protein|uniref:arsenic transporter n=1 Tax=Achromobacter TaxID=222 RepID=UPI0006F8A354|nr:MULTISPECIES: arsenic transporter [Achromobacter]KRB09666.1 arsenic transporter [Achromobacter sp. Root170]TQJ96774.1 arsenite efflux membrane protein ArsB [Achromobacter sp. SLBN-14]CAB3848373.1 Arsenical pump membrane protein [Achromobacter mucicolens]